MKIRTALIPAIGEDFLPQAVMRAEQKFAASLAKEATPRPAVRRVLVPPRSAPARQSGRDLGRHFARISSADHDLRQSFVQAICSAVAVNRRRDDEAREIAQDSDSLRDLGFYGRDEDD